MAEDILEQAQRPGAVPVCSTLAFLHRLPVQHPLVPDVLEGDRVSLFDRDRDWLFGLGEVVRCVYVWELDYPSWSGGVRSLHVPAGGEGSASIE